MNKETGVNSHTNLLYIDSLRAIAALYVLLHHAVLQYYDKGTEEVAGIKKVLIYALYQGQLFVDLFIVISGFCLMRPIIKANYELRGGSLQFFKKRVIRILPPYFMAMVVSLLLIRMCIGKLTGTHWDISIPHDYKSVIAHVLLIHDVFKQYAFSINHSFWSISVECRIYLLFPVIVLVWRKFGAVATISLFLIVSMLIYQGLYLVQAKTNAINLYTPGFSPYVLLFVFGMLAAEIVNPQSRIYAVTSKFPWLIIFIGSVLLFAVTRVYINKNHIDAQSFSYQWINITFGLLCFVLLVVCAHPVKGSGKLLSWLSYKPLAFLGTFAYSIYLIHAPLLQVLTQYVITPLRLSAFNSTLLLLALSIVVILPLAYVFYLFGEKPFINAGKKSSKAADFSLQKN